MPLNRAKANEISLHERKSSRCQWTNFEQDIVWSAANFVTHEGIKVLLLTCQGTERLDLRRLAQQFGLEVEALRKLLERDGNQFVFDQNYDSILSRYRHRKCPNEV
jgi:hypothetical protein